MLASDRPPPMDINQDDLLVVHATNSLDQPATLHHHGMYFNATTWYDGAIGVSQWSVQRVYLGESSYSFHVCT